LGRVVRPNRSKSNNFCFRLGTTNRLRPFVCHCQTNKKFTQADRRDQTCHQQPKTKKKEERAKKSSDCQPTPLDSRFCIYPPSACGFGAVCSFFPFHRKQSSSLLLKKNVQTIHHPRDLCYCFIRNGSERRDGLSRNNNKCIGAPRNIALFWVW
jgi:hypothetical protein